MSRIGWFAIVGLVFLVGAGALLWSFSRRLTFFPASLEPVEAVHWIRGAEDAQIRTEDGHTLGGWFLPPPSAAPTVLVCNGNGGNRAGRVPLALALAERGLGVLLFDYRGYGENLGSPSEAGLIADARAARAWLDRRSEVTSVVYFGESLGTGVAVALATERPPAALVLRSPFTSLVDVGRMHYPYLPVGLLLRDRFPSLQRIRSTRAPLLIVAGDRDGIVPPELSRELYEAAPQADKDWLLVEGAGHNDPELAHGTTMIDRIVALTDGVRAEDR